MDHQSAPQKDDMYWESVEAFIAEANRQTEQSGDGAITAEAILHAAARYLSFHLASCSASRDDLKQDVQALILDVPREFKRLLATNLEEYVEHYNDIFPGDSPDT